LECALDEHHLVLATEEIIWTSLRLPVNNGHLVYCSFCSLLLFLLLYHCGLCCILFSKNALSLSGLFGSDTLSLGCLLSDMLSSFLSTNALSLSSLLGGDALLLDSLASSPLSGNALLLSSCVGGSALLGSSILGCDALSLSNLLGHNALLHSSLLGSKALLLISYRLGFFRHVDGCQPFDIHMHARCECPLVVSQIYPLLQPPPLCPGVWRG
jgi:hypothetical protein